MKFPAKSWYGLLALGALSVFWLNAARSGDAATHENAPSSASAPATLSAEQRAAAEKEPVGKVVKTDEEWKKILTPEQYYILRQAGTERAFSGDYKSQGAGLYRCAGCGLSLYDAKTKFDSGTGWPSFYQPIVASHVIERTDEDGARTEVLCARCNGHLGHVFNDGPPPTGLRYCMNSPALKFEPAHTTKQAPNRSDGKPAMLQKADFAAGCFWSMEAVFEQLKGVRNVEPGYAGGAVKNPTYEQVCSGETGHAETIEVTFDSSVISYADLLHVLFTMHDPTTLNQQGADVGTQYRSAIFYRNPAQKKTALAAIKKLAADKVWPNSIVTQIKPLENFYRAEEYHRDYFTKNPTAGYCQVVIEPKIAKLRANFPELLKP